MAESEKTEVELSVRKLRKKLREIERLEQRSEPLSAEEKAKVAKTPEIRSRLLRLLSQHGDISSSALSRPIKKEPVEDATPDVSWEEERSVSEEPGSTKSDDSRLATPEWSYVSCQATSREPSIVERLPAASDVVRVTEREKQTPVNERTETSPNISKKKQKKQKPGDPEQRLSPSERWKNSRFLVRSLEGHDGLVTAVALRGDVLLTGSHDTTVRRWDVTRCEEVRSMCGHTDSVTGIVLLTPDDSTLLAMQLRDLSSEGGGDVAAATDDASVSTTTDSALLGISGSLDCCIKVWNLETGFCVRSVYTFNPLTCLKLLRTDDRFYIVCGTGGGKLEVWDLSSSLSCPLQSTIAYKDSVTAITLDGLEIYSTSADGVMKVFEFYSGPLMRLIHDSEDVETKSGKRIGCVAVSKETVYVGNEGANVRATDWRSGSVRRLANHTTEFGKTSCLLTDVEGLLISTGYDLDHGYGYVNVRSLPDEKYLCSLCDEETSLIVAMAAGCSQDGGVTMVTGGMQLKVWKQLTNEKDQRITEEWTLLTALHVPQFDRPAPDSDVSDRESDSDHDFRDDPPAPWQKGIDRHGYEGTEGAWLSWCNLV